MTVISSSNINNKPGRKLSIYEEDECFWCTRLGVFKKWKMFCSKRCRDRYERKKLREYSLRKYQEYVDLNKTLEFNEAVGRHPK